MIHWILAYKHPIFIRRAFRHPATSLSPAHSPPWSLDSGSSLREQRAESNCLLFWTFLRHVWHRLWKFLVKIVRIFATGRKLAQARKIRSRNDRAEIWLSINDEFIVQKSALRSREISVWSSVPPMKRVSVICLIFSHDRFSISR